MSRPTFDADAPPSAQEIYGAGCCEHCEHSHVQRGTNDKRFWRCRLSEDDPRFPRYPPLPVIRCVGFRHAPEASAPIESTNNSNSV